MRTEREVFSAILDFAKSQESIRIVTLEGSRANPHIKKDRFRDYDISFFLDKASLQKFRDDINDSWLKIFGNLLMIQKPESMELYPPDLKEGWFSYLMLFGDGVRIDLTLIPLEDVEFYRNHERLMRVLLDKDNRLKNVLPASDCAFYVKPLTKQSFLDCCNEFYWLYVCSLKDILRSETLLANAHLIMMREGLLILLSWYVAINQNNFSFSLGKEYKFLPRFLVPKEAQKLYACYRLGGKKQAKKTRKNLERFFAKIAQKIMRSRFRQDFQTLPYRAGAKTYAKILKHLRNGNS